MSFAEVEAALVQETRQRELLTAYDAQLEAATLTFEESRQQYLAGLTNHLSVLTALQGQLQAELNVITARRDVIGARIQLHQALGGSWTRTWTE